MNELTIHAHEKLYDYLDWFRQSLEFNGFSSRRAAPIHTNEGLGVIEWKGKRVLLDWGDSAFYIPEEVADCDVFLKANLSSEIMAGMDLPDYPVEVARAGRELFEKYHDRIRPFVLGRKNTGGVFTPPQNVEKNVSVVSYSAKAVLDSDYVKQRENFYQFAYSTMGSNFLLAYPGYPGEKLSPLLGDYGTYLAFLSQGYFVLNLVGWAGSNPFRCIDACLAGSCILSDMFLADAFKDYPAVMLPGCCYTGEFDWDTTRSILEVLATNPKPIFDELYPKQLEWFRKNLSLENHCWQVLKYFIRD
jgi:hypothetical protein